MGRDHLRAVIIYGPGSFAGRDHLWAVIIYGPGSFAGRDHLRAGIICGPVQVGHKHIRKAEEVTFKPNFSSLRVFRLPKHIHVEWN